MSLYYYKYKYKYQKYLKKYRGGNGNSNGNVLSDKQQQFLEALEDMREILLANKLSYFLFCGTALGCYREGTFIEHDPDIDLGMEAHSFRRLVEMKSTIMDGDGDGDKFRLIKYYPVAKDGDGDGQVTEVCYSHLKTGVKIDIFLVEATPKGYLHYSYGKACDKRPNQRCEYLNRFHLVWKDFMGGRYKVPSIDFLESHYGKDWMVKKEFSYSEGVNSGGYKSLR